MPRTDASTAGGARAIQVALVLAAAGLFAPFTLLVATGRVMPTTDMRGFHIPLRFLYQQALRAGDSILWTPSIYSGTYLHGEGQGGFLHPLHLLLYWALPLRTAVSLELLLNYLVACGGAYLLCRRLCRVGRVGAGVGALLFAFSGFNLMHAAHLNMVAVLAHLPWVLWLTDIVLVDGDSRRRRGAALALAAVIGSQWLLGFPQAIYFTLLAALPLVLIRWLHGAPVTSLALCAVAALLGTGIGLVQILPTLDVAADAYRAKSGPDFALTFSLHPMNVLQFWSPYTWPSRVYTADEPPVPHEFATYDGAFSLLAVVWLALRFRHLDPDRRRIVLLIGGLGLVALVLAFGRFGVVQPLLVELPGMAIFRAPARYVALVHLALAALAAIAVDDLVAARVEGRVRPRRLAFLAIPFVAGAVTVCLVNGRLVDAASVNGLAPLRTAASGLVWPGLLTVAMMAAGRRAAWALPVLIVLAAADVGRWGYSFVLAEQGVSLRELRTQARVPPAVPRRDYLLRPSGMPEGNLPVMRGWHLADGYLALSPKREFDTADPVDRELSGARWIWNGERWDVVAAPLEPVRLVTAARVERNPARHLQSVDVRRTALVETDVGAMAGPPGTARLALERPGRMIVETEVPSRQLLVTTRRYHAGWRSVRGCTGDLLRVYDVFLGCVVEAGTQTVELRFSPRSFTAGAVASAVSLSVWIAAVVAVMWDRRLGAAPARHGCSSSIV